MLYPISSSALSFAVAFFSQKPAGIVCELPAPIGLCRRDLLLSLEMFSLSFSSVALCSSGGKIILKSKISEN